MGPLSLILPGFVWLLFAGWVSCSEVSPHFLLEPLSTSQKLGGPVELQCAMEPASFPLSWLFNGQPLVGQLLSGVEVSQGRLSIPSLQPHHVGRYQCLAGDATAALVSRNSYISIADLSEFEELPQRSLTVEEGGTARIGCHLPHSVPAAQARFRFRGKWLEPEADKYIILPSGSLQILSVSSQDQGVYKCGAFNSVTRELKVERHGTRLSVQGRQRDSPLQILHPTSTQVVTPLLSDSLTLECVTAGGSPTTVRWTRGGRELPETGRRRIHHGNLQWDSLRETDTGEYQCVAESEAGETQTASYTMQVLEPTSLLRPLADQTVPLKSTARFTCMAAGDPVPNVTWLHNGVPLHPSPRYQLSKTRLRILSVEVADGGLYQCLADNGLGSVQSSAQLIVESGPASKPVISLHPSDVKVSEGDFVSLSCNATGHPPPLIRWYDSQGPISSHPSLLLLSQAPHDSAKTSAGETLHVAMSRAGTSLLYIQAATQWHSGKYVCEGTNEMGSVQAEAFISVAPLESTTLSSATPSGGVGLVQGDEGEDYSEGLGEDKSTSPTTRSSGGATPEAPIILSAPQTHKPDTYDLVWRPGRDWGTPINAYFVRYRKLDDKGNMVGAWHSVRVPGSENELRLTELDPSSLYEVLMVARSAAGEGQPAMLTFRTSKERTSSSSKKIPQVPSIPASVPKRQPLDEGLHTNYGVVVPDLSRHSGVPEAPDRPTVSMATQSSVYVTWIPRANGGSPITAFRVEYRRLGRNSDWMVAADNIPPSKLSVEVKNLEAGSAYKFRVSAINMYGESPHSAASRPYQVAGFSNRVSNRPIAGPRIDNTEAISDTQIMLRWTYTPSSNNNTPIQGFYIYYRPTDSDNDSDYKKDIVQGTKHWHLISQLQPETSYDIKMQCFNEGGESEFSNVMICETKVKRAPGASDFPVVLPDDLVTPSNPLERGVGSGSHSPVLHSRDTLYLIVGCMLGLMVLILVVFICICLWKSRQQHTQQKYDPPGYLYQGAEMNGHMEYTTLPGTSLINGGVHSSYVSNGSLCNGCPHLHHKVSGAGTATLNGGTGCPCYEMSLGYEHTTPHLRNGGGMYKALPQMDPSECVNCRNCRNNNRCFSKSNYSLPVVHRVSPCRQDSLEMVPLNHAPSTPRCDSSSVSEGHGDSGDGVKGVHVPASSTELPCTFSSEPNELHACCQLGDVQAAPQGEEQPEQSLTPELEGSSLCWDALVFSPLDSEETAAWTSECSTLGGCAMDNCAGVFRRTQLQDS
uniref:Cell adhesion molecule-related/down-regulated by oncogenes n=1 Tax=Erpetoichthys calabaricus TaxID=27687 RepID=A0A8C4SLX4_ERPCA